MLMSIIFISALLWPLFNRDNLNHLLICPNLSTRRCSPTVLSIYWSPLCIIGFIYLNQVIVLCDLVHFVILRIPLILTCACQLFWLFNRWWILLTLNLVDWGINEILDSKPLFQCLCAHLKYSYTFEQNTRVSVIATNYQSQFKAVLQVKGYVKQEACLVSAMYLEMNDNHNILLSIQFNRNYASMQTNSNIYVSYKLYWIFIVSL